VIRFRFSTTEVIVRQEYTVGEEGAAPSETTLTHEAGGMEIFYRYRRQTIGYVRFLLTKTTPPLLSMKESPFNSTVPA